MADFEQECFFIAPIGEKGSEIRKRSNDVRDWILKPAAEAHGLAAVRADDVGEPGQITAQAVQHCLKAKAAVADLTGGNPNVYYELSVRHGAQLPVVLIAEEGTKLPFDISQSRVIFFKHNDLASAGKAKEELEEHIGASLSGPPDNPIYDGMRLAQLQGGNVEEQTLAHLMRRMDALTAATDDIARQVRRNGRPRRVGRTFVVPDSEVPEDLREILDRVRTEEETRAEILAEAAADDHPPTDEQLADLRRIRDQLEDHPDGHPDD